MSLRRGRLAGPSFESNNRGIILILSKPCAHQSGHDISLIALERLDKSPYTVPASMPILRS